jgi:uncharacterized membrane protein
VRSSLTQGHLIEFAALAAFTGVAGLCSIIWSAPRSLLAGFSVASISYVLTVALVLQRASADELPSLAARHDQRASTVLISGLAIVFAAIGLVIVFLLSRKIGAVAVGLATLSILAAWILLNTLFAIHYAHVYFSPSANGKPPLSYPGDQPRAYSDFLYFAFVIGMTFQVSDVAIGDAGLRRLSLAHAILAFLFNVFVLALAVNAFGSVL